MSEIELRLECMKLAIELALHLNKDATVIAQQMYEFIKTKPS
jgi:hypothetical protein